MNKANVIDVFSKVDRFKDIKFWKFDESTSCLTYRSPEGHGYDIPLIQCRSSAMILDWITQVSKKRFATKEIIGDLVLALDAVLDLQANYCSCGADLGLRSIDEMNYLIECSSDYWRSSIGGV